MPSDLARFRTLTMGKPMIMGRRTFESIGRVLPGRESIVVSRSLSDVPAGAFLASDPDRAIDIAEARAAATGANEIALIGGAALFAEMMPQVDRLHLTIVELSPEADTFFPSVDFRVWRETCRVAQMRQPSDDAACLFVDYERETHGYVRPHSSV